MNNYIDGREVRRSDGVSLDFSGSLGDIVCDEEVMDKARG